MDARVARASMIWLSLHPPPASETSAFNENRRATTPQGPPFGARRLKHHAACFGEMIKTPAIVAKPHGVGPEFDDEVVQLRGRHEGFDVVPARPARPLGIAKDLAPA